MSDLRVLVTEIHDIKPHPNADAISLATIGGWQTVIKRDQFKDGDLVIYFPPDAVLPVSVSDLLGVTPYLSKGRVRSIRLRGEVSHGFVIPADTAHQLDDDVTDWYGVTKYEPPVKITDGDAAVDEPAFPKYTNIENLRNHIRVITDGAEVVVTEKIHGTNCRVGRIGGRFMAGSSALVRKEPADWSKSIYWFPLSDDAMKNLVIGAGALGHSIVVYCEVYGSRIQGGAFSYDAGTKLAYRVFDIAIDGRYLPHADVEALCYHYGVKMVPVLYVGAYALDTIKRLANESSTFGAIREGVVVKTVDEKTHPTIGRVILKYLSDEFMLKQSKNRDSGVEEIAH